MTTAGVITDYTLNTKLLDPMDITIGPDGARWFTASRAIGRLTTTGTVSHFKDRYGPMGITAGPDGALWFTNVTSIGRITT